MANCVFFSAERTCGYSKQLKIDLDNKTVEIGYCLANFQTQLKVKSCKELEKIKNEFVGCGFKQIRE